MRDIGPEELGRRALTLNRQMRLSAGDDAETARQLQQEVVNLADTVALSATVEVQHIAPPPGQMRRRGADQSHAWVSSWLGPGFYRCFALARDYSERRTAFAESQR